MLLDFLILGSGDAHSGINIGDFAFQLIAFAILVFLLKKFAFGPVMKMMKTREEKVANDIDEAKRNREEAAALMDKQTELLKQASLEAQQNIEASRKQGELQRKQIIEVAEQEAQKIREEATALIEKQTKEAVADLKKQAVNLSIEITKKVISKELTAKDQEEMINRYLGEVEE